MILRDHECPTCLQVFEAWGNAGQDAPCPTCNTMSPSVITRIGFVLPFTDEGFPRAWRRWSDHHERAARKPDKE